MSSDDVELLEQIDSLADKYANEFDDLDNNPTHNVGSPWYNAIDNRIDNPLIDDDNIIKNHKFEKIDFDKKEAIT